MKAPKGKGKKPSGGKQDRGFERARHDAPRSESKFEGRSDGKSDNKGSSFKKPRPQFAKAAPKPVDDKPATPLREIKPYAGARPGERLPLILETEPSPDYALLDSGNGLKLEQYGPYRIVRPEGQAIWLPSLPQKEWDQADAVFTGNTDEEGMGRWAFPKVPLGETWPMQHDGISFHGRFTSFRHVGVFPEQAAHWSYMDGLIRDGVKSGRSVKVLNLFGYTGVASLVAARAGAEVTHVDASKKAILWARENQEMAGLSDKPIRWICEDAMKFVQREERRGSFYDIILLDPPAYGRGPSGEVWQLFEHLPAMVDTCRSILTPKPLAVILTAYSIRASFFAIHELMRDRFTGLGGTVESGELILRERSADQSGGRALSTSMFSRWVPK
ncbi:class I SAM-dependent rRNA methyltransferase [Brucella sp. JSBI001]|uniref:class I SAM-dependent rRNA methyltransferase n=1 Tax=Brucella sp. JSBI001 TaxID=2886044 RepID=UPI002230F088|nr:MULTISPECIES: class I SAM-dependent rRNA methyltransferase [Brucella]UZD70040.1 class I SAM-dependent rRNA methyltransferase [Brucella sp. JSBI001]